MFKVSSFMLISKNGRVSMTDSKLNTERKGIMCIRNLRNGKF